MSQEFDNDVLDIVKKKDFILLSIRLILKSYDKTNYVAKKSFRVFLTGRKGNDKEYDRVLKVWNKFKIKTMKDYHDLYSKHDVLLLADLFGKFRNNC